jgi:hypothetical protein
MKDIKLRLKFEDILVTNIQKKAYFLLQFQNFFKYKNTHIKSNNTNIENVNLFLQKFFFNIATTYLHQPKS